MDINKGFTEEMAMSGKLKMTEKQEVAVQHNQTHQRILKVKKDLNHHWDKWIQKM